MTVAGGPREKGCGEDQSGAKSCKMVATVRYANHGRVVRRNEFYSDDPLLHLNCIPGLVLLRVLVIF